ncbi:MAG TPA: hypothetical protein VFC78_02860 [Tepidisphaeraceae bacterium]|nr:hypothetical protein [Tepidisphaeraceae bacterium]
MKWIRETWGSGLSHMSSPGPDATMAMHQMTYCRACLPEGAAGIEMEDG